MDCYLNIKHIRLDQICLIFQNRLPHCALFNEWVRFVALAQFQNIMIQNYFHEWRDATSRNEWNGFYLTYTSYFENSTLFLTEKWVRFH